MTLSFRWISASRLHRWISAPLSRASAGRRNGTGSHRLLYRRPLRNSMRKRKTGLCADAKLKSPAGAHICGKTAVTLMGRRCPGRRTDWDPDSKLYKDSRFFDDAVPPEIPREFKKLVDGALHAAHNFLRQCSKSVEEIPNMSPDVCIVISMGIVANLVYISIRIEVADTPSGSKRPVRGARAKGCPISPRHWCATEHRFDHCPQGLQRPLRRFVSFGRGEGPLSRLRR
ncbi:hypothetical protein KSP40_PGU022605 [Platanthera guangdongensis]|uniref:Uncharacterized protein n=1 Tax=Platanthera guangdongensis TaxID=2320717 RepID=A0ABR2M7Z4_9ASPA